MPLACMFIHDSTYLLYHILLLQLVLVLRIVW